MLLAAGAALQEVGHGGAATWAAGDNLHIHQLPLQLHPVRLALGVPLDLQELPLRLRPVLQPEQRADEAKPVLAAPGRRLLGVRQRQLRGAARMRHGERQGSCGPRGRAGTLRTRRS